MLVQQVMTRYPVTVNVDTTLGEALKMMHDGQFHHLPVINRDVSLIGVLSERDIRHALNIAVLDQQPAQLTALERTVRSAMTLAPIVVEPNTSVWEAGKLMLHYRIGCLPVIRGETVIGIITRSDILKSLLHDSDSGETRATP
jgi:acetoin utilization protein AcuB